MLLRALLVWALTMPAVYSLAGQPFTGHGSPSARNTSALTTGSSSTPPNSRRIQSRHFGANLGWGVLTGDTIPGYIGQRPETTPDGDYVQATFCYCKTESSTHHKRTWENGGGGVWGPYPPGAGDPFGNDGTEPGELLQGHIWRYDYYNYHLDKTYRLTHYCMEDTFPIDRYGCGYDSPGHWNPDPNPKDFNIEDWVLGMSTDKTHTYTISKHTRGPDRVHFGRYTTVYSELQVRRLDSKQGLIQTPADEVEAVCQEACQTELLLPKDPTVHSHEEIYNKLADMCDHCR